MSKKIHLVVEEVERIDLSDLGGQALEAFEPAVRVWKEKYGGAATISFDGPDYEGLDTLVLSITRPENAVEKKARLKKARQLAARKKAAKQRQVIKLQQLLGKSA